MDFAYSPRTQELRQRVIAFMDAHVYPAESQFWSELEAHTQQGKRWTPLQVIEQLKPKARAAVIVMPERLVPGLMAMACAMPMMSAGFSDMSDIRFVVRP
jgi:alkylation response protein AidB-like acyl-CoA dehydrogenase